MGFGQGNSGLHQNFVGKLSNHGRMNDVYFRGGLSGDNGDAADDLEDGEENVAFEHAQEK